MQSSQRRERLIGRCARLAPKEVAEPPLPVWRALVRARVASWPSAALSALPSGATSSIEPASWGCSSAARRLCTVRLMRLITARSAWLCVRSRRRPLGSGPARRSGEWRASPWVSRGASGPHGERRGEVGGLRVEERGEGAGRRRLGPGRPKGVRTEGEQPAYDGVEQAAECCRERAWRDDSDQEHDETGQ